MLREKGCVLHGTDSLRKCVRILLYVEPDAENSISEFQYRYVQVPDWIGNGAEFWRKMDVAKGTDM